MSNKNLFNNKIAKGLVSLISIVVLLSSILATSIYYSGNITGFVVSDVSINQQSTTINIQELNDINELNQLNEGWYEIRNGFVFYLDTFNSYAPLWIKVLNPEQQNGLFVVDENGNIEFYDKDKQSIEKEPVEEEIEVKSIATTITGKVTGLEKVSGFAIQTLPGSTTFSEVKVGDILNGKKVIKVETIGATRMITVEDGETYSSSPSTRIDLKNDAEARIVFLNPLTLEREVSGFATYSTFGEALDKATSDEIVKIGEREYRLLKATVPKQGGGTEEKPVLSPINNPTIAYGRTQSELYVRSDERFNFELAPQGFDITKKGSQTIGGKNYYSDGSKFLGIGDEGKKAYESTISGKPTQTFYFSAKDSSGTTGILEIHAIGPDEARKKIPKGFTEVKLLSEGIKPTGQFKVKKDGEKEIVTNGIQSYFVPEGKDSHEYAQELNDKAKINEEYNKWLKSQNLKDTVDNRNLFKEHPPSDINNNLIAETLGLTPAQKEEAKKEKLPYERIKLPDDTYVFIYNKKQYFGDTSGNTPQDLQGILDFKKNHPTAVLQEGFKTSANKDVYFEKGSYIDETGAPVSEAIKKEKIGEKEYEVTYGFNKGKKIPRKIKIDDKDTAINDNVLKELKSNVKKEDKINVVGNNIVVYKASTTSKEGKEGTDSYRETTTTTTLTYNSNGLTKSESLVETKDKDGNVIVLKERTQTYTYNKERGQDVPKETTERIYEKKEGETSIDKNSADFTEVTTNSITGEPLRLSIGVGDNIILTAFYDPNTKEITGDQKAIEQLSTLRTQYKVRTFFSDVERIFTEFQGLGYYATLFFEEDELLKWRDNVDKIFATLYLGTEYWSSAICGQYLDGEDIGIAYAETPQGLAQVAAHIEATRTEPIETISVNNATGKTTKETQFIYKITFNVRNGDYDKDPRAPEEMNINVVLKGQKTVKVFKEDQKIKRGKSFGKTGKDAIAQESKVLYNQVCLTFDKIPLRWRLDNKELCNKIQETGLPYQQKIPAEKVEGGAATEKVGGAGDINDF